MTTTPAILDKEEHFHDEWAESIDPKTVMVDEFFEACTSPENRYIITSLGNLKGKKILELGCGAGEGAVYFAKKGADVTATDISSGMLDVVKKVATLHGTSVHTAQAYADKISFPDESFDVVYAANLLHHVDIEAALIESKRVLKPGGTFVSWDPIAHNPVINIYRRMAMGVRTEDEHPIKMHQIDIFRRHFSQVRYETFWFATLCIFLKFFFIDRVHPNKERYWKKILVEHKKLEPLYNRLARVDRVLFRFFPFLKRYAWNIVVIGTK